MRGGRLKLIDVQLEDQGQYVCSAENPVGKESSIANITVQSELKNLHWCFCMQMLLKKDLVGGLIYSLKTEKTIKVLLITKIVGILSKDFSPKNWHTCIHLHSIFNYGVCKIFAKNLFC